MNKNALRKRKEPKEKEYIKYINIYKNYIIYNNIYIL